MDNIGPPWLLYNVTLINDNFTITTTCIGHTPAEAEKIAVETLLVEGIPLAVLESCKIGDVEYVGIA